MFTLSKGGGIGQTRVDRMRHWFTFTVNSREEGATHEKDGERFVSKEEHISEY